MAAPTYATDLTDIWLFGTSNWTALGGGASGLNDEGDYWIENGACISKNAWASATKGMIYDGGTQTISGDNALFIWITHLTSNSLDNESAGGLQVLIGDNTSAYKHWYIGGKDTLLYDTRWLCACVDPDITADNTTGSPSSTTATFGGLAKMVGGPTKGAPFAIDAIRYGRAFTCTNGDVTNGYASFGGNGSDGGAAAWSDNTITRRYGQIQLSGGTYKLQGLFEMGTSGTSVDFRDSDRVLFIANTKKVNSTFNGFEVNNSSSRVDWTNISIKALGTVSKGYFTANANATINIDSCNFVGMNTFTFGGSLSSVTSTTFRDCGVITQAGGTIDGCTIVGNTSGDGAAAIVSNDITKVKNCDFTFSDGHAIELTSAHAASPTEHQMDGNTFTGYGANDSTDAAIYNNSGKALIINVTNGAAPTVRNGSGASTTVNVSVPVKVTVVDKSNKPLGNVQTSVHLTDGTEVVNEDTHVITAGSFVTDTKYTIVTVGTTDFTAIGASSNTVGVAFTATGAGSGTGTATDGVADGTFGGTTPAACYIRTRKSSTGA